jgi:hypothetical protein
MNSNHTFFNAYVILLQDQPDSASFTPEDSEGFPLTYFLVYHLHSRGSPGSTGLGYEQIRGLVWAKKVLTRPEYVPRLNKSTRICACNERTLTEHSKKTEASLTVICYAGLSARLFRLIPLSALWDMQFMLASPQRIAKVSLYPTLLAQESYNP